MVRSMTGFGRYEFAADGVLTTAEAVSVNGRFLEIRTKLPREIQPFEAEIRKMAQEYLARGRVTLSFGLDQPGLRARGMRVDFALAERYIAIARDLAERYGIESNINSRTLLSLPDILLWNDHGSNGITWDIVRQALEPALAAHKAMREEEGRAIEADFRIRLAAIAGILDTIERLAPSATTANTERLRQKISSLVGEGYDESRFSMEVALYADKVDITEECVRLRSHIDQFEKELDRENASGRTFTFLLQEMNRETNTIGSKIMDAEIAQFAVRIKEELEKMREQAENVE